MQTEKRIFDIYIWLLAVSVLLGMLTGACTKQQACLSVARSQAGVILLPPENGGKTKRESGGNTRYGSSQVGRATNKIKTIRGR